MKRVLITTANEYTWPKDKNEHILFLGEWCKRHDRKFVWGDLNTIVAPYHWDNREKLYNDYLYLQEVYESQLKKLSVKLNHIHGVNYSVRYWRILIGPWLGTFIQIVFDRWYMLKQVIENSKVKKCRIIDRDDKIIILNDMSDYSNLYLEDKWNEAIYGELINRCWDKKIYIEKIDYKQDIVDKNKSTFVKLSLRERFKKIFYKIISSFNKLIQNDNDFFFLFSYLPLKIDLFLQLKLGQIPKIWRPFGIPKFKPNVSQRNWSVNSNVEIDPFIKLIGDMIPDHIPTAYLEGYNSLTDITYKLPWPKNPRAIFTSVSFATDDVFKTWTAGKIESGSRLVVGQHGGNFGTSKFSFYEDHQLMISDIFLSWGWNKSKYNNISPIGNFKASADSVSYNPNGKALLVEMFISRYSYYLCSLPVAGQWLNYFEEQCRFIRALPLSIQKQISVRLFRHAKQRRNHASEEACWKDQKFEVNYELGDKPIKELVRGSRLYISTYNATTFLESLTWNIPSIIFWNPEYNELCDDAIPYFELLESVGIFHKTPESAANQMIKVWDDVLRWWNSKEVQNARKEFCKYWSYTGVDVINRLQIELEKTSNKNY